jgi:predicted metalloprotease with PDZ domain
MTSKSCVINPLGLLSLFTLLTFAVSAQSPQLSCVVDRISTAQRSLHVSCELSGLRAGKINLQFTDQFAGIAGLAERVRGLQIINPATGERRKPEILGDGAWSFDSLSGPGTLEYEVGLARAYDPGQHALVSSLGLESAVLMPGDLLPELCQGEACARVRRLKIHSPDGWQIATTERLGKDAYDIPRPERAVFFVARMRRSSDSGGKNRFRSAIAGTWSFPDNEVFRLVDAVGREQAAMVESSEQGSYLAILAPYPQPMTGLRSSAVTIGRTVVLMLNESEIPAASFPHFRKHLAHEMFHYYLPNAFHIRENFDWFWEGFTRYIGILSLCRLQAISTQEYLDFIGTEYDSYAANPLRLQVSLIEASPEKFAGPATYDLVYRKGSLIAALYDLELRRQSQGKSDVTAVIRALFQSHALKDLEIGNREVLEELRKPGQLADQIRDDIEGVRPIELEKRIKSFGMLIETGRQTGWKTRLVLSPRISDRQRQLIEQISRGK